VADKEKIKETTEGLKREKQIDSFKATMRKVRRISGWGILTLLLPVLLDTFIDPLPLAWALWIIGLTPLLVWYFTHSFKIVFAWETGAVFRMGKLLGRIRKPGLRFIFWPFDSIVFVNMWERRIDIEPQKIVIEEKIGEQKLYFTVPVDVIFYFRIKDAKKALTEVENLDEAASDLVESVLREKTADLDIKSLIGKMGDLAEKIKGELETKMEPWGVVVVTIKFKEVSLPPDIDEAYKKVFIAEKEKQATILDSEGEAQSIENVAKGKAKSTELTFTAVQKYDDPDKGYPILTRKVLMELGNNKAALLAPVEALSMMGKGAAFGKGFVLGEGQNES